MTNNSSIKYIKNISNICVLFDIWIYEKNTTKLKKIILNKKNVFRIRKILTDRNG